MDLRYRMKTKFKQIKLGIIPEDWKIKKFGEVIEQIFSGGTPDTATPTNSPCLIILYFEIVFAVFFTMDFEKHSEHSFSPEYFLVYAAGFSHLSHVIKLIIIFH